MENLSPIDIARRNLVSTILHPSHNVAFTFDFDPLPIDTKAITDTWPIRLWAEHVYPGKVGKPIRIDCDALTYDLLHAGFLPSAYCDYDMPWEFDVRVDYAEIHCPDRECVLLYEVAGRHEFAIHNHVDGCYYDGTAITLGRKIHVVNPKMKIAAQQAPANSPEIYRQLFHQRILPALAKADQAWPLYNSPHEGHAVLKEEAETLWMEVKMRSQSEDRMLDELIDIAVVAFRFAHTLMAGRDVPQPLDNLESQA